MNALLLSTTVAMIALVACQQEGAQQPVSPQAPPEAVTKAFQKTHGATASPTGWEMEEGDVEMEYMVNSMRISELYDTDGNLLSTESPIDPAQLPEAVRNAIAADAPDNTIESAESIVSPEDMQYEVVLHGPDGVRELIYSADGMAIGEEADDDDGGETDEDDDGTKP